MWSTLPPPFTAHRRGVIPVGVEWRVQVDEVNRRRVEAAQDVQVVPGPNGAVSEVGYLVHDLNPKCVDLVKLAAVKLNDDIIARISGD